MCRDPKHLYKLSFGGSALNINASVEVAQLHRDARDWKQARAIALTNGVTALPKAASRRRTLREIVNRLQMLTDEELAILADDADRAEQQALLWLASCRAYRFVREFAREVVQDRFLALQLDLPLEAFDVLFDAKAEWHPELAAISRSTRLKLRQVLYRMMREAGIISDENRIQHAYLSRRLMAMIEAHDPGELAYFPGFAPAGAI